MIEVRRLTVHEEFAEAVQLQQEIWGFADIELLPVRLFITATKVGGQAFGAYDAGRMVAFLLAIPGLKPDGKHYLHSHMLGVRAEYRNSGLGRALKLEQRADALARGIELVEWTFDPLELKNAYFNIERLGAVVQRYLPNQYGTTSSRLHGGLPTDRLVAEWYVAGDRAKARINGSPYQAGLVRGRVSVPVQIADWRTSDPARARDVQQQVAAQFQEYIADHLAVIGFEKSPEAGTYVFGQLSI